MNACCYCGADCDDVECSFCEELADLCDAAARAEGDGAAQKAGNAALARLREKSRPTKASLGEGCRWVGVSDD